ncbi:MAG: hypothetical protein AAGK01_04965, partial [Pseudomonadota bacterium]
MTKANIFITSGWIGLAGLGSFLFAAIDGVPIAVAIAGGLVAVAACWAMLFTRNADEYTRDLWTAGSSMAFAIMLMLFLMIPFFEGVYDGFNNAHTGGENAERDIPAFVTIAAAIVAFYIGLFWKKVMGG